MYRRVFDLSSLRPFKHYVVCTKSVIIYGRYLEARDWCEFFTVRRTG